MQILLGGHPCYTLPLSFRNLTAESKGQSGIASNGWLVLTFLEWACMFLCVDGANKKILEECIENWGYFVFVYSQKSVKRLDVSKLLQLISCSVGSFECVNLNLAKKKKALSCFFSSSRLFFLCYSENRRRDSASATMLVLPFDTAQKSQNAVIRRAQRAGRSAGSRSRISELSAS